MKPVNSIFKIVIFCIFFSACQKERIEKPQPNRDYPTTYKPLNSVEWNNLNNEFQKIKIDSGLILNEYGYVNGEIQLNEEDSITLEFVICKVEELVEQYRYFMGIPDDYLIHVDSDITGEDYYTGINFSFEIYDFFDYIKEIEPYFFIEDYMFSLHQKQINSSEFNGPNLLFNFFLEANTLKIYGNYFPNAFIPVNQIYTLDDAIITTYHFILKEKGIDLWESKHLFTSSIILVLRYVDSNIEIRECWKIEVDELEGINYLFIDTQTGEILSWCIECFYI